MTGETCSFCGREGIAGVRSHHVIPRCKHGKETVPACESCESFIHATWSHNQLRDEYNTVEKTVSDDRFQKYLRWLLKQDLQTVFKTARHTDRPKGRYR